jgi:hypothetical protein
MVTGLGASFASQRGLRCCTKSQVEFGFCSFLSRFSCKYRRNRGGRCWDRTSDLCRVKAVRRFARAFWSLQNTCK